MRNIKEEGDPCLQQMHTHLPTMMGIMVSVYSPLKPKLWFAYGRAGLCVRRGDSSGCRYFHFLRFCHRAMRLDSLTRFPLGYHYCLCRSHFVSTNASSAASERKTPLLGIMGEPSVCDGRPYAGRRTPACSHTRF